MGNLQPPSKIYSIKVATFDNLNICDGNTLADPTQVWFDPQLGLVKMPQNVIHRQGLMPTLKTRNELNQLLPWNVVLNDKVIPSELAA